VTACRYRGIQSCAGLLACAIVALSSASTATASTNATDTVIAPTRNDKSGLETLALQVVGQIQSQQEATLQAVQNSQQQLASSSKQNAETFRFLVTRLKIAIVIGILLGAAMLAVLLYVRAALRSIQRPVRSNVAPPPASGVTQRVASLLDTGEHLLNLKQPGSALVCFDEVLALDAHHTGAHVKKAAALEQLDRLDEALACYDHALALDDSLADAYVGKGAIYNRLERYREALECYEHAARLQPTINISQIQSLP
jgi:tetratricopeptide (TPR) repeat protein